MSLQEYKEIFLELSYGQEKNISVQNLLIIEPIMKKLNGKWVSASHDITTEYNDDFSHARIINHSGCNEVLELCFRVIKVFKL